MPNRFQIHPLSIEQTCIYKYSWPYTAHLIFYRSAECICFQFQGRASCLSHPIAISIAPKPRRLNIYNQVDTFSICICRSPLSWIYVVKTSCMAYECDLCHPMPTHVTLPWIFPPGNVWRTLLGSGCRCCTPISAQLCPQIPLSHTMRSLFRSNIWTTCETF